MSQTDHATTGRIPEPSDAAPGRRHRRGGQRRARRITALVLAVAVLLGGAGLGYLYLRLDGNINGVDINTQLGGDRPRNPSNGSTDILVLGSDSRAGRDGRYGQDGGSARSDTAMVVHVAKGHRSATVVSIPRDTLVDRPACATPGGGTAPARRSDMFNDAYQVGGPACAVKTVESMTGIRMDHYLEVDFAGFTRLVDALGGVPVTTTEAIDDPDSHLDLAPGTHTLDGEQALGLVRTRHGVGDGSDLGRIKLQQAFVKALLARVRGVGVLTDPGKLYGVADTATRSLTTDSQLASVGALTELARSLNAIGPGGLQLLTMPVRYDPDDPDRVRPLDRADQQVWQALRADRPVPDAATQGAAGQTAQARGLVRS